MATDRVSRLVTILRALREADWAGAPGILFRETIAAISGAFQSDLAASGLLDESAVRTVRNPAGSQDRRGRAAIEAYGREEDLRIVELSAKTIKDRARRAAAQADRAESEAMLARLRRIKVQLGLAQELKRRGLRLSYDEKTGRLLVSSAPKNYDWSDLTEIVWRSTGLFRPDSAQGVPSEESAPSQPVDLFFSYSHHDSLLREELEKQLSVVKRLGLVRTWHDGKIGPGADIDREVNKHLENSDLILLLVSPDFIASDYCWSTEMLRALERHRAGQARVVPIILRPCDWQVTVFGKLNALPKDGKAVVSAAWDSRDAAFYNVALGIRKTVEELLTRRDE